ncbi:MAG: T9SS type A sorting domain-containing protein [Bacteroidetes bacterium]|nr:T9SS type A sorting domain-containing protein [Bacteroidota bacterium]
MLNFKCLIITTILSFYSVIAYPQPQIGWQKCFGGSSNDTFDNVVKTLDGGFICLGRTNSDDFDLEGVCCPDGTLQIWLIKFDSLFSIQWQTLFKFHSGGVESLDNIFVNADSTYTLIGTVSGETELCTCNHSESQDIWFVIVDSTGSIIDQKCYGGSSYELLMSVSKCADSGYIIGATTGSGDGDVGMHYGDGFTPDAFVLKIDQSGDLQWSKVIGGSSYDGAFVAGLTEDRYFVNVATSSFDYDLEGLMPVGEISARWLLILDSDGNIINQGFLPTYDLQLELNNVYQLGANNYILVGTNEIDTGDFVGNHGGNDASIGIFDSNLNLEKIIQFGGSDLDGFERMVAVNGSLYFSGYTYSSDYDCEINRGEGDVFIVKTDTAILKLWSKSLGSSGTDKLSGVLFLDTLTVFGSSALSGVNDGDILNAHFDELIGESTEAWAIKFDEPNLIETILSDNIIKIYPNPSTSEVFVYLNLDSISATFKLLVHDQFGSVKGAYTLQNGQHSINTTSFEAGLYVFSILNELDQVIESFKIIIL